MEDAMMDDFFDNMNNVNMIELVEMIENPKRKYKIQKRIDPFEIYEEDEFKMRYRLSKQLVWKLYHLLDGPITLEPQVNRDIIFMNNLKSMLKSYFFKFSIG